MRPATPPNLRGLKLTAKLARVTTFPSERTVEQGGFARMVAGLMVELDKGRTALGEAESGARVGTRPATDVERAKRVVQRV